MLLVVDANELFSALIARGKTLNIFFEHGLEFVSPEFILREFEKHKEEIARKSGLSIEEVNSFFILLFPKIKIFNAEEYKNFLPLAKKISPDMDDVEYLALALKLNCPLWSEDKSLKRQSLVAVYNTEEIKKLLVTNK